MLFLFGFELFTTSIKSNNDKENHVDFTLPVNHRIPNNILEFSRSAYIDYTLERFMERNALTGASIAVIKNEKLVFSKSYGYASADKYELAEPKHLFRIASVSKLITAVAIMKLVQDGQLELDSKVFGKNGAIPIDSALKVRDKRLFDITIRQLLSHKGGWTQNWGDPMFNLPSIAKKIDADLPLTPNDLVRFVCSRRLHFSPGRSYSYSNMGYVFLGMVIEKITGFSYETYVKQNILSPIGIYDMHIGHYLKSNKKSNEVEYYEYEGTNWVTSCYDQNEKVQKTYGGNDIQLLNSAGGWIASAPELAKFMTAIDGDSMVSDILQQEYLEEMISTPNYPIGWSKVVHKQYLYRTGSFTGTQAMICRRNDGLQWVFLTNCGHWKGPDFPRDIHYIMNRVMQRVKNWPEVDLFNYYNPEQNDLADL